MKNLYVLITISIVIFSSSLNAQWVRTNGASGSIFSLAASDTNLFAGNNNGKIFRSTDNGTSWTTVYNGTTGIRADAFAISDTNLFATIDAVFRSTNNGATWTAAGLTNVGPQALAISDTNLFAGTYENGIFRSTNNGTSWNAVNSGLTGSQLYITALFVSDTNLFAGTWGSGALRSTNNGSTWTSANNGLTSNNVHAFTVSPNPAGGTNLFAGTYFGSGVYLSTDNGESWTAVSNGLTNSNVRALACSDTNLFAGTDGGGVFLSTNNGISWTEVNTGLTNTIVNALVVSDTFLFAGTGDGVWRRPLSEMLTSTIPTAGLQMWLKADEGIDTLNGKVSRWHDQSGKGNDAIQFNTVRQPLFVGGELNQKPVLRFDGWDDKLGFTGTTPMSQFTLFMVVKNYSGGGEHNSHVINFGPFGGDPNQLFALLWGGFDRVPDLILFGAGDGGMFASAPNIAANGEWRIISILFETRFNTTLRWNGNNATMSVNEPGPSFFGPMGDSTGSGGGIAGADRNGNLLLTAKCDFAEAIVYDTLLTDSEILAVENYLADKYNISITTGVEDPQEEIIPEQFTLSQNYPNPFNPSTTIKFQVPNSSFVNLKVYDMLGREVATLVNEEKPAGNYEVNFNASQLSSGIYFYSLKAGKYSQTKKLILMK